MLHVDATEPPPCGENAGDGSARCPPGPLDTGAMMLREFLIRYKYARRRLPLKLAIAGRG